jgi:hypothetical protein
MEQQKCFKTLVNKENGLYCNFHVENDDVTVHESSYPELWGRYVFYTDIVSYINNKLPENTVNWSLIKDKYNLVDVELSFPLN